MTRDLRLLLPAIACWLASLAGQLAGQLPGWSSGHSWRLPLALACLAIAAAIGSRRGLAVVVPICAFAALAGSATAVLHEASLSAEPVSGWAQHRLTADIDGVVVTPLRTRNLAHAAVWAPTQWHEQFLATTWVRVRGQQVAVDVPLMLRLDEAGLAQPPGTHVRVHGQLGAVQPGVDAAAVVHVSTPMRPTAPPGPVDALADAMRTGLVTALAGLPADGAALVAGLAVGDESLQDPGLADAMRASGLSHLTAVSGGNTAIVCGLVLALAAVLRLPVAVRAGLAGAALAFYVVLVGPQPSVLRAAAMGGLMLIALVVGGRQAGVPALATAVIGLVVVAPSLAVSWGFALSVLATGGLLLLAPRVDDWLARLPYAHRLPNGVRIAVSVTIAAQVATLPVLVLMGSAVGWVSIPANVLSEPAVAPVTVIGLVVAAASPVLPGAAAVVAHLAWVPAAWIAAVARAACTWPFAGLTWPVGVPGVLALGAVVVGVLVARRSIAHHWPAGLPRPVARRWASGALVVALAVASLRQAARGWPPPNWLLIACDVGQGDALLVRSGAGHAVVVDAGPEPSTVRQCLHDAGVDRVDAVVLTHFHADHVAGLSGIVEAYDVPVILTGPLPEPPDQFEAVTRLAGDHRVPLGLIQAGEVRRVGDLEWTALWPRRIIAAGSAPNNASVVLLVRVDHRQLLLCGDIEPPAQAAVSASLAGLRLDAVKIPHHGSRFQNPSLPSWARAPIALISVGADNDYGHPSASTISAWQQAGSLVGRTDRDGDLAVVGEADGTTGLVARGQ